MSCTGLALVVISISYSVVKGAFAILHGYDDGFFWALVILGAIFPILFITTAVLLHRRLKATADLEGVAISSDLFTAASGSRESKRYPWQWRSGSFDPTRHFPSRLPRSSVVLPGQKSKRVNVTRLLKMSVPDVWLLIGGTLALLIAAAGQVAVPHFMGTVVDTVIDKDTVAFHNSLIFLGVSAFLTSVFSGMRGGLFSICIARLKIRLRELLFSRILDQDMAFFDAEKTGEITSRLSADTTKMGDAIGNNLNVFLRSVVQVLAAGGDARGGGGVDGVDQEEWQV